MNLIPSGNNGVPYFGIRIRMIDEESSKSVRSYIQSKAKKEKKDGKEEYIFVDGGYVLDDDKREIVKILGRTIELTREVNSDVRSGIEDIIAGYQPKR